MSIVNSNVRVSHVLLVVTAVAAYFQAAAVQVASCGSNAQDTGQDADEGWADVCNDALCNRVSWQSDVLGPGLQWLTKCCMQKGCCQG